MKKEIVKEVQRENNVVLLNLATTPNKNHLLEIRDQDSMYVLTPDGMVKNTISKGENARRYVTKNGDFILIDFKNGGGILLQQFKVVREIEGYEDTAIKDIPVECIEYSACYNIINAYADNEWETPFKINRIKNTIENLIKGGIKNV